MVASDVSHGLQTDACLFLTELRRDLASVWRTPGVLGANKAFGAFQEVQWGRRKARSSLFLPFV